ncbi:unnamed protein product [Prunus armeniaca]|uniref:Uncharacterized protein n=1 Tax=Prunus armeniaca TaxID=36596 RepID=A0A6J5V8R7_PRUAR|nr:hypothetical protein GBA52_018785 [Prunus armeniaca]CAB4285420.1 unnamed protein product [Prunus armeniaca]
MASATTDPPTPSTLFAAIDMGTNSFKMLIVRAYPNGKFFTIDQFKEPVVLGRDTSTSSTTTPFTLSHHSQLLALEALKRFQNILKSYKINKTHVRCVATAAVREAVNNVGFLKCVREEVGLEIDVLPGEQEARLEYLGMLQFFPIYEKLVLGVDIGGGSTEFVIGKQGKVIFGASLKLGHVNLTQKFGNNEENVAHMREHIRLVVQESGLVDKIKDCGFEVVVGSSGTIKAVEKAALYGYANVSNMLQVGNMVSFGDSKRYWKLSRGELKGVVESFCGGGEAEKIRREKFFKMRSEFIVAGAVLLEEIFEVIGIEEMEISGYSLAEGVIAETLAKVNDYDLNANAKWSSIVRLAMRFNSNKRMRAAAQCASIAKEFFECLRKCDDELAGNQVAASLDDKDLEYLEASCLLHNIGLSIEKKGYHKHSYSIIMNGGHLQGYSTEEVKLIALLARHHRKKLPNFGHVSFKEFPTEVKKKFRFLCAIIRISVALQQHRRIDFQQMEFSHSYEGFKLACGGVKVQNSPPCILEPLAEDIGDDLRQELEHFKMVFHEELLLLVPSSVSG